jgi:hypothetical protein
MPPSSTLDSLIDNLGDRMTVLGTASNGDVLEALGTRVATAVLRRIEGHHEVWFMVVVAASTET